MSDRTRPLLVYLLVWVMSYMALRDALGWVMTVHKVHWLWHPGELAVLLVRGGAAVATARGLWTGARWAPTLGLAWLVVFGVVTPVAAFGWDPFVTLRGPLFVAVPTLFPMGWAWWTARRSRGYGGA